MTSIAEAYALAVRYHQAGQLQQAEQLYRQVLQHDPGHFDALNFLGIVLLHLGRPDEAAAALLQAHQLQPQDADTLNDLGSVYLTGGKLEAAVDCYRKVLQLRPGHALAHYNLGLASQNLGKVDSAIVFYQQALALQPDHLDARSNLGVALALRGRHDEAIDCYRQVLRVRPDLGAVHINLGKSLGEKRQWEEAIACYRQALRLKPNDAEAYFSMGIALTEQSKFDEVLACYEQALRYDPGRAEAHLNRAFVWLLLGRWAEGWRDFEWRIKCKGFRPFVYRQPRWDGSPLGQRSLLLVGEQGFGDTLHFIRYARLLEKQGNRFFVECQAPLERLLKHNLGAAKVVKEGDPIGETDFWVPLPSLPGIFGTTPASVPAEVPYLEAEENLVAKWRQELKPLQGFKIGITWQGNPTFGSDRERSIPLAYFAPLAKVAGVQLVSLQKGQATEHMHNLQEPFPVHDVGSRLDDFMDTAAVVKCLDLVICCDTAVAHLAGALGKAVWVALAIRPDWRWQLNREDSPWYPTMRLFRQTQARRWTDVFERMAYALSEIKF